MLAVQYHESTVTQDSDLLCKQAEVIAGLAGLQFRLQHVRAHQDDKKNNLMDSMYTAVIRKSDMEPRTQGPTKTTPFDASNKCAQTGMAVAAAEDIKDADTIEVYYTYY